MYKRQLQSRSSEATNIGYQFSSRAVFGWILFELNSGCGNLGAVSYTHLDVYKRQEYVKMPKLLDLTKNAAEDEMKAIGLKADFAYEKGSSCLLYTSQ